MHHKLCGMMIVLLFLSTRLISCGPAQGGGGGADVGAGEGDFGLNDAKTWWTGTMRSADENASDEDPDEASLALDTKKKTFRLTLPKTKDAEASGTFEDFQGESWMMTVEKSSISKFGVKGDLVELSYELKGKTLALRNKRIDIRLVQTTPPTGNVDQGQDPEPGAPTINGRWICRDQEANTWVLEIGASEIFATVSKSGSRAMWFKGSLRRAASDEDENTIRVTDSNNEAVIGSELLVDLVSPQNSLRVRTITRSQSGNPIVRETIGCKR